MNLTRFNLFFPEKRRVLPGRARHLRVWRRIRSRRAAAINRDIPILFFSRQVGLSQGQSVPVVAGGRLTGRAGVYTVGAINIQTGEKASARAPATNFSDCRLKRDILRRSTVGLIATRRDPSGMSDSNVAGGLDASFGFFDSLNASGYYARTTPRPSGTGLQRELSHVSSVRRGSRRCRGRAPGDRARTSTRKSGTSAAATSVGPTVWRGSALAHPGADLSASCRGREASTISRMRPARSCRTARCPAISVRRPWLRRPGGPRIQRPHSRLVMAAGSRFPRTPSQMELAGSCQSQRYKLQAA